MLDGQVAIVSGAGQGIGRGIALGLAAQGADIVALDIDEAANERTAALVRAVHAERRSGTTKVLPLRCDVGSATEVASAFATARRNFERFDILINNAALWLNCALTGGSFETQTAAFARSMNSCALGSFHCAMAALPGMRSAGGGNIINIITEHIREGHMLTDAPAAIGYDCAKWSQWRMTETWAKELAPLNIRVNALCMGATDTPMLRGVAEALADSAMKVEDVAAAVLHVLARGAQGPTGQSYLFGTSGTPRAESLQQIAALASH